MILTSNSMSITSTHNNILHFLLLVYFSELLAPASYGGVRSLDGPAVPAVLFLTPPLTMESGPATPLPACPEPLILILLHFNQSTYG